MLMAPPPPTQVSVMLSHADDWAFDMFQFSELTGNRPLSTLAFHLLKQSGIISCLRLTEDRLGRWVAHE